MQQRTNQPGPPATARRPRSPILGLGGGLLLAAASLLGGPAAGCHASGKIADAQPVGPASRSATSAPSAPLPAPNQERADVIEQFWPDGTLRERRHVIRLPNGTMLNHGLWTRWHRNGQKEYEARYDRGRLDGVERTWHENGRPRTEQHYSAGLRNGPRIAWDPQGRKRKEEHYRNDRPVGVWTIWDPHGRIVWQGRYDP